MAKGHQLYDFNSNVEVAKWRRDFLSFVRINAHHTTLPDVPMD